MSDERVARAKERLSLYYDAEVSILSGQAYTIGSRSLTRANLNEVRRAIADLETQVTLLSSGGKRKVKRIIPLDI